MKNLSKWAGALVAVVVFGGSAAAAHEVAAGTVKSTNAEKKSVVLTDAAGKEATFHLGDNLVVNRDGKEGPGELKVGDAVNVCYDKGLTTWTAHYVLVQEGGSKKAWLVYGIVKSFDADKKELALTDSNGKDMVCSTGSAKVRLNNADSTVETIKVGEKCLAILEPMGDVAILKTLMFERK